MTVGHCGIVKVNQCTDNSGRMVWIVPGCLVDSVLEHLVEQTSPYSFHL
jgi:hypothetical protein